MVGRRRLLIAASVVVLIGAVSLGAAWERKAPDIDATAWLNGDPVSMADLEGRVVLVEFWTFGCWNCRNVEPYFKAWHAKYADDGLVILAVHAPEFDHEREVERVRAYLRENGIEYAVPIDNEFATWRAYSNIAWPTWYLIDQSGRIVYSHMGEGAYAETEARIVELLAE